MLLHIDNKIVEIRPSELFESKTPITSRYLEPFSKVLKTKTKTKASLPKKNAFVGNKNASSSTES